MTYKYTYEQLHKDAPDAAYKIYIGYERVIKMYGKINYDDYKTADSGVIKAESPEQACEKLFGIYNTSHPEGYTGRSMSVSDIVNLWDNSQEPPIKTSWYCDAIGFVQLGEDGKRVE